MISLLNVKKCVSLQLNVRHDVSCIYMSSSDDSKMWKFNEPSDERSLYQSLVRAYSSVVQGIHIPTVRD